ncbi:DegT/DnrJ/EryC1/StrS family aminotransferase [uncultured Fretibacterium sp.]|uniref:DegT/DnrJ/EryC1/StrS family aminotransferase n=1 Tax=uncultured Fretibacterium sp. TaxID=1678694 RepID=UPI002634BE91|nr:DegT/DnrJ/EryC1/StrS family aminotransferase [uncultured Fretibacterium sp.]
MAKQDRIYLSPPHMSGDEAVRVSEAFASNWIAPLGPHVEAFEREVAERVGVRAALATSSGTAALHLAGALLGIGRGDLVLCASFTFAASVAPAFHAGAELAFVDSEPGSWNMSPDALERALADCEKRGKLPKAIILVDLYGQSCDMDPLLALSARYGVPVIEDAAEALGSTYRGRPNGSFGAFAALSFNGNKIITTSGGGMLLSNDEEAIARARFLATQARDPAPWYQHSTLGWNYRLSNVLAGIGRGQLVHLDERIAARRRIFDRYVEALGEVQGLSFMPEPSWSCSNRWLSAVVLTDPIKASPLSVLERLESCNIEGRPLWKPMHLQPVFKGADYWPHEPGLNVSRDLFERGLCLPSGTAMTERQQDRVIAAVREAVGAPKVIAV